MRTASFRLSQTFRLTGQQIKRVPWLSINTNTVDNGNVIDITARTKANRKGLRLGDLRHFRPCKGNVKPAVTVDGHRSRTAKDFNARRGSGRVADAQVDANAGHDEARTSISARLRDRHAKAIRLRAGDVHVRRGEAVLELLRIVHLQNVRAAKLNVIHLRAALKEVDGKLGRWPSSATSGGTSGCFSLCRTRVLRLSCATSRGR